MSTTDSTLENLKKGPPQRCGDTSQRDDRKQIYRRNFSFVTLKNVLINSFIFASLGNFLLSKQLLSQPDEVTCRGKTKS